MRPVETINCTHVEPNGKACRRVAYRNLFYCHAHRHLYPDAKTRTDYVTRPKTWSEREKKHSPKPRHSSGELYEYRRSRLPKQDAVEGDERPVAKADGPSLPLLIIGAIFALWIFIKLAEEGFMDNMSSGSGCNGLECCLAPFAAAPALGRSSSTGKFTHGKTYSSPKELSKVTYCLHMDSHNGKKCRRMVMKQSGLCYQHQDSDAVEVFLKAAGVDRSYGDVLRYNIDGATKAVSSKDIDVLVEGLGKAKKFWVVDLALDETEFVQFTYDGDIDDDNQRDGVAVFEHWKDGKMISRASRYDVHKLRAIDRVRSLLTGEEPDPPENPKCEELGFCEFDETGRCHYCFTYSPDWDTYSPDWDSTSE